MSSGPGRAELPDRARYRSRWSALHGGYDPATSTAVNGWLALVEAVARPLARRGISPNSLTGLGVTLASAAVPAASRSGLVSGAAVIASGFVDNLDGAVAVLTDAATPLGYLVDSLADRVADGCYLAALGRVGAPAKVTLVAAGAISTLEYARARAGNAGFGEIGLVTVGERPTRIIVVAAGLALTGLMPSRARLMATAAAGVTAALATVGAAQFLWVAVRQLQAGAQGGQEGPISPATPLADSATSGNPPPG